MVDWSLGTFVQVGMRLFNHRAEVQATAERVKKLLDEAAIVLPELQALVNKIAPELTKAAPVPAPVGAPHGLPPEYTVEWLQSALNQLIGANLKVDGIPGEATRAAIQTYQRSRGLEADGWAGLVTTAMIDAELRA